MHKNKLIFIFATIILAGITFFVTSRFVFTDNHENVMPLPGGSSIKVGLPGVISNTNEEVFDAASAILWDEDNQSILFEQNSFERRPIASITKLMTAMIALDHDIDWDKEVKILPEDHAIGSRLNLHPGEHLTMRDLFAASLLGSANNATNAYVRELGISREEFVRMMNRRAIEMGLYQTEFTDLTGLSNKNISTAYEVAQLAAIAFNQYPKISEFTALKEYEMKFGGTDRKHTIKNTNRLLAGGDVELSGSKTGFIYDSLYCLVIQGRGEYQNRISVILGSPNNQAHYMDAQKLLHLAIP